MIDLGIKFGPKLFVAIAIMVAGYIAGRYAERGMMRMLQRVELEPPVRSLLGKIIRVMVLGLFAIMALQNLGVELLPLIAGLGVFGAGVALATQGVLANLVAGLTIIFTKPFRVGEYISIVGEEGEVEAVSLFNTILQHADRSRVVIPNRRIVGEILHNYGQLRQLRLQVGVAYDTDLTQALARINEVLQCNPRVLRDPAPLIQVSNLADSSIQIAICPWVQVPDFGAAGGEVYQAVVAAFRGAGVVIPFPQRELRMLSN